MYLLNFYKLPLYYAKAVILILEIEKNLSRYIRREYEKLESQDKQRSFIENFRFLMMSSDTDFQNFYSKRSLNDREFYSIVNSLYQLNNLCMLFIDESGDFGPYEIHAPYYLVSMILHNQNTDISENIKVFDAHLSI